MISALVLIAALLLDAVFGEPKKHHPLVMFGHLATRFEQWSRTWSFHRVSLVMRGAIGWVLLVLLPGLLLWQLLAQLSQSWNFLAVALEAVVLYFAIGWKSLREHALAVFRPLQQGELEDAREKVGMIVSRDTADLDPQGVTKAAVESVLENGSDGVFGAIFWFLVLGAPGALMYRLANTLDAMWGYRSERYLAFGRAAAKLDDALNWLPARLTAFSYASVGQFTTAVSCMRAQGAQTDSPNAGQVMAAGAGALGVCLGGSAIYRGEIEQRPLLGEGSEVVPDDILRAVALVQRALLLWVLVVVLLVVLS